MSWSRGVLVLPLALLLSCQALPTEPPPLQLNIGPSASTDNSACDQTIASCRRFGHYGPALMKFPNGRTVANCALLDALLANGQGATDNSRFSCDTLVEFCRMTDYVHLDAGSVADCLCAAARCFACDSTYFYYDTICQYVELP